MNMNDAIAHLEQARSDVKRLMQTTGYQQEGEWIGPYAHHILDEIEAALQVLEQLNGLDG